MTHSLAAWYTLAAGAVLSGAYSYFLFTEKKILSTKKMCLRVRVCLHQDGSDRITGFFLFLNVLHRSSAAHTRSLLWTAFTWNLLPSLSKHPSPCHDIFQLGSKSSRYCGFLSSHCQRVLFSFYSLKASVLCRPGHAYVVKFQTICDCPLTR